MNCHKVEPTDHVPSIVLIFQWFVDQVKDHNYSNTNFGQGQVKIVSISIFELHLHLSMQNSMKGIISMAIFLTKQSVEKAKIEAVSTMQRKQKAKRIFKRRQFTQCYPGEKHGRPLKTKSAWRTSTMIQPNVSTVDFIFSGTSGKLQSLASVLLIRKGFKALNGYSHQRKPKHINWNKKAIRFSVVIIRIRFFVTMFTSSVASSSCRVTFNFLVKKSRTLPVKLRCEFAAVTVALAADFLPQLTPVPRLCIKSLLDSVLWAITFYEFSNNLVDLCV